MIEIQQLWIIPGGEVLKIFLVGMCRWENILPIHLPNFDSKLDPYIYEKSKICSDFEKFLPNFC